MDPTLVAAGLGVFIGLMMALTGAGGGILSVPLLVFALGLPMVDAAPVSMIAIALSAGLGALLALRAGILRYRAAGVMGLAGLLFSPLGVWLAHRLPNRPLTMGFALVLAYVGLRTFWSLWRERADATARLAARHAAGDSQGESESVATAPELPPRPHRPPCCLDPADGRLRWTAPCARALLVTGMGAGFLSGLLGVGGGFVIVPSLGRVTDLEMRSIVATSLGVLTIVALAGLAASAFIAPVRWSVAVPFATGALAGMLMGRGMANRFSGPRLQGLFACLALMVACGLAVRAAQG